MLFRCARLHTYLAVPTSISDLLVWIEARKNGVMPDERFVPLPAFHRATGHVFIGSRPPEPPAHLTGDAL